MSSGCCSGIPEHSDSVLSSKALGPGPGRTPCTHRSLQHWISINTGFLSTLDIRASGVLCDLGWGGACCPARRPQSCRGRGPPPPPRRSGRSSRSGCWGGLSLMGWFWTNKLEDVCTVYWLLTWSFCWGAGREEALVSWADEPHGRPSPPRASWAGAGAGAGCGGALSPGGAARAGTAGSAGGAGGLRRGLLRGGGVPGHSPAPWAARRGAGG